MFYTTLKQQGAVLILMAFIIGLGTAAYIVKTMNVVATQADQDKKTFNALGRAKSALIAWSVSHEYSPGQMPWPDRNGDGNYDGSSDCVATPFQYRYLIGQLPTLPTTSPCLDPKTGLIAYAGLSTYPGLGEELKDAQGNPLWYAVSRNLVRNYETATNPVINPGIVNAPTYQWLQVLGRNGNLISNRVAAVIIAPGSAIGNQDRTGNAPGASAYLDSFQIGAAMFSNRGYATEDEDFVLGEDTRHVSARDPTLNQPYYFNDKLVYITIDELMAALDKRVGEEVRSTLKDYQDTHGYYPYAAQLGTSINFACELTTIAGTTGLTSGHLPTDNQSCTYTSTDTTQTSLTCTQSIFDTSNSGITQIVFDGTSGEPISDTSTGLCTRNSPTRCTCTGIGTCGSVTSGIDCTATSCTSSGSQGSYEITGGKFRSRTGGCAQTTFPTKTALDCSNSNSVITCNTSNGTTSSCGDADFGSMLPIWFESNLWQPYVFYQMTRPASPTIMVGSRTTEAVAITMGSPIIASPFTVKGSAQLTPSCNAINNYLDSIENTDADIVFDATNKQRTTDYNDQTFTVAP